MGNMSKSAWLSRRFLFELVACVGLITALGVPSVQAQFRPDYWEMVAESERERAEQARVLEREQLEARLAERSARAHARMLEEGGFSAGLTGAVDWHAAHPNVFGSGSGGYNNYTYVAPPQQRYTFWSSLGLDFPIWQDVAPEGEPIESLYSDYISEQIVQARCVTCHVKGGASGVGVSRLQFSPSTVVDHINLNRGVFDTFVSTVEDPVDLILNKVQGVAHGGGIQLTAGTADYANLERFLRQLADESSSGSSTVTAENLFDGVTMASPQRTLRRAAILFAGRLPTQTELDAVSDGEEASLRTTIRGLMSGAAFHDFLIRGSNDRLLTDRQVRSDQGVINTATTTEFVELARKYWALSNLAISRGYEYNTADPDFSEWEDAVYFGLARAPIELIAHVVENDKPYTEILTADYIMANPMAAEGYGATTQFENVNDPQEFKPSEIVSYYRNDDSKITEFDRRFGTNIINAGNLLTDYPHAGILNTTGFLTRYPSTATNRNRARSRWTYYHFLGLDVEKSASRTIDPVALADTNNPTLNNPACTVCHTILDPVAGTFQNYGDSGLYRDQYGGMDSLPELYKHSQDGSNSPYVDGDTWYRDMRMPGLGDEAAPNAENSVQWLAQKIVTDDRFAEAAVKFWWPAIMGVEILDPPEDSNDPGAQGHLVAATAQAAEVNRLAAAFRTGIAGGSAYNGRDLLAEIALSPWFRAESFTGEDSVRATALRDAGVARLLTPEELNRKTDSVAGFVWGRHFRQTMNPERGELLSYLDDFRGGVGDSTYQLLYGGIDSTGIITRATDMTPVMAAVAQSHAAEVGCPIVRREFFFLEDGNRRLFDGISKFDTPVSEIFRAFDVTADAYETRQTLSLEVPMIAGRKTVRLAFTNDYSHEEEDRNLNVDRLHVRDSMGATVTEIELESLPSSYCGEPAGDSNSFYKFWGHGEICSLEVALEISRDDVYQIDIVAHQDKAGDVPAHMSVEVESEDGVSNGHTTIRRKLVDLHEKLFGVEVAFDSTDVDEAFEVFFEVWSGNRRTEGTHFSESLFACEHSDHTYYDGLVEDPWTYAEWGDSTFNWNQLNTLYEQTDMTDPTYAVRAWAVTLMFLMADYRYLYL